MITLQANPCTSNFPGTPDQVCFPYFSLSVTANAETGDSPKSKLKTGRRCALVSYSRTWWYPVPTATLAWAPWLGRNPKSVTQIGTWRSRKSLGTWRENKESDYKNKHFHMGTITAYLSFLVSLAFSTIKLWAVQLILKISSNWVNPWIRCPTTNTYLPWQDLLIQAVNSTSHSFYITNGNCWLQ